ncbi:hypothetical protein QTO34_018562 [Cnephaeus nilssonii]|uniref:UBX domain-containing protein n=1 Tax=Cnephaeus nilssonii TaxID=3371016 RepID=A0AA40HZ37_CNENI|nr:hypothetical protein QTO34_018562 [Eptesicus nilssonii]
MAKLRVSPLTCHLFDLVLCINKKCDQATVIRQAGRGGDRACNPGIGPVNEIQGAGLSHQLDIVSTAPEVSRIARGVCPARLAQLLLYRMLCFFPRHRQKAVSIFCLDSLTVKVLKFSLSGEIIVTVSALLEKCFKLCDLGQGTNYKQVDVPKNVYIYIITPNCPPCQPGNVGSLQESVEHSYLKKISHRSVVLEFLINTGGSSCIERLLPDVPQLAGLPADSQGRRSWFDSCTNDIMCLAESGLSYPCHRLTVGRRSSPAQTREQSEEQSTDVHMVSDSDGDDFEDAPEFGVDDGEVFGMASTALRKSPMMPENAENEGDALLQFTAEFSSRYGDCHPVFFIGSLEAAFQEAFYVKARDRKLLAIYLHHDESVLTNVFCSQMLCAESIVSYLSQNFITWAWDLTKDANRARFLTMCNRHFGSVVAQTIRTQKTDQFPLFLIIMGKRSSNEVLNVIQGNTTVDELMMRLMAAMEIFTAQQQEDIKDEDEREARENVKREQDEAYRLSLEADRAKREAHEREMAEQSRLEQIRKEQEEEREAIRLSLEQALPPEPKEDAEPVSKLRIRTPSGEFLERRFLASNKLQIVFDFVTSKGFPWNEFKLLSTFPRRDVSSYAFLGKCVQMGDVPSLGLDKVVQAKSNGTAFGEEMTSKDPSSSNTH